MPRIAPVPWEEIEAEDRAVIERAVAEGRLSTPVLPRIIAHNTASLRTFIDQIASSESNGLLDVRLKEMVRLRSAQLGGCAMCAGRVGAGVTEQEAACALAGATDDMSPREQRALAFVDAMHADHHAIDDETYRQLGEVFTPAEVVELALLVAGLLGMHRFLHTLDVLGTSEPAIGLSGAQIVAT